MSELDNTPNSETRDRTRNLADRVRSLKLPANGGAARGGRLPWVLCVLLLITTVAFAARSFMGGPSPATESKPPADPGRTADSGDVVLENKGYIIPAHQIQVSPRTGGIVVELLFEEGQRVSECYLLARLKSDEYEPDVARGRAALAATEQRYQELTRSLGMEIKMAEAEAFENQANLVNARQVFERRRRLIATKSTSDDEVQEAEARVRALEQRSELLKIKVQMLKEGTRKDQIEAAAANVDQVRADLDKALQRLDWCTIKAPVSGTILTKKAEKGNIVNPIAFNVSANVCEMADLSDLEVDLSIQERDISHVVVGQECRVMPEAFQNVEAFLKGHPQGYSGKVSRLMPIADRAKGAIPVRVKVQEPREEEGVYLKPDMSVIVSFLKPKS